MATVHPEIAFLLEGMISTPLAPLAADAVSLIAAEPETGPFFNDAKAAGIGRRERELILRQVDLIEQAVFFRIKAERHYRARIRDLAPELELKRVVLMAPDDDQRRFEDIGMDDLTSGTTEEAILVFANVYSQALESVRRRWRRRR